MSNKDETVIEFLANLNMDVACLSETWLKENMGNNAFNMGGFITHRLDRTILNENGNVKRGGGLCTIVRNGLKHEILEGKFHKVMNENCELLTLKICLPCTRDIYVVSAYRPPDGNIIEFNATVGVALGKLAQGKKDVDIILGGDINVDYSVKSVHSDRLKTLETANGLKQYIREPTRPLYTDKVIDLIFSNMKDVRETGVIHVNISDHVPVYIVRKKMRSKNTRVMFEGRSYKKYNKNKMVETANGETWDNFANCGDPDRAWDIFIGRLHEYLNKECPIRKFDVRDNKPKWLTNDILKRIRDRDIALKKAIKSGKLEDTQAAKMLKNETNACVKGAKSKYLKKQLLENVKNPKKFWGILKDILPKQQKTVCLNLKNNNNEDIPLEETADHINTFFAKVGENLADKIVDTGRVYEINVVKPQDNLDLIEVSTDDLKKEIMDINIDKSSGLDNVSARVLKDYLLCLIDKFLYIINLSLAKGIFPSKWKRAKISPIPKVSNPSDVSDLRPISLLPITGKILEKFVHKQTARYLEVNRLLTDKQSGFRKNRSTIDAVLELDRYIFESLNEGNVVGAIYIDYRKAFDTINHRKLLLKLPKYGFSQKTVNWFKSYLEDRVQKTIANGTYSGWEDVTFGVPQGSILGPLLFIIYVNDLSNLNFKSNLLQYADDTVIYVAGSCTDDIAQKLQNDLDVLVSWCDVNQLTINAKKTKVMLYTYSEDEVMKDIIVKGVVLECVDNYKYLGIILDSDMSYKSQLQKTISQMNSKIWMLKHYRNNMNVSTALIVLKAMIIPYIDNSTLFLSNIRLFDQKRLQILQNIAIRVCFKVKDPTDISIKKLHQRANVLPTDLRRIYLQSIVCYRLIGLNALSLIENRVTRAGDGPIIVNYTAHTRRVQLSPAYAAIDTWNAINSGVRNAETNLAFKNEVKSTIRKYFKDRWSHELQYTTT